MADILGRYIAHEIPRYGVYSRIGAESTPPGYTFAAKGVTFDGDGIVMQKGRTKLNSSAAFSGGRITAGFDMQNPDGRQEILCGSGKIAKIVNGTVTNLVTGRTTNAIERMRVFMGQGIFTNGFDPVIALTLNGGVTNLTTLGAPVSKCIEVYNNVCWLAHQPDGSNGPSVLQNSGTRDLSAWSVLNAYNIESNNADVIHALFKLGGYLAIGKEDSITFLRGNFFDQTSSSYDAYVLPPFTGGGVLCPMVAYDRFGRALYFNEGGFWLHSAVDVAPKHLSNCIHPDIKRINLGRADEMSIVHIPQEMEFRVSVPVGGVFEQWRYIYRPECLKNGVGAWFMEPWTNHSALWGFEASLDETFPRAGDTSGFAQKLDDSWSDNGSDYTNFCEASNIRGRGSQYDNWTWVLATMDNTGQDVTMECYPDDARDDPETRTISCSDAQNRLITEQEIPITGTGRRMGLKFIGGGANKPWGLRELRLVSQADSYIDAGA